MSLPGVCGSRRAWPFVLALFAAFSAVSACGGRTSMLDLDAYAEGGRSALGGGGSAGKGGNANQGKGGASAVAASCKDYCSTFAKLCPEEQTEKTCRTSCDSELNEAGGRCRDLGLNAINCIRPQLQETGARCEYALEAAAAVCAPAIQAFENCKDRASPPDAPVPGPMPNPQPPKPLPPPQRSDCQGSGSASPTFCDQQWACEDGFVYAAFCENLNGAATCLCLQGGDVARQVGAGPFSASTCQLAAAICGFPVN